MANVHFKQKLGATDLDSHFIKLKSKVCFSWITLYTLNIPVLKIMFKNIQLQLFLQAEQ